MEDIWYIWNFITVLLLVFGLFMVLAGIFTAYFGRGKSRAVGGIMLVVGLIIGVLIVMMTTRFGGSMAFLNDEISLSILIMDTIGFLIATAIGVLVALGVFLAAIMKS